MMLLLLSIFKSILYGEVITCLNILSYCAVLCHVMLLFRVFVLLYLLIISKQNCTFCYVGRNGDHTTTTVRVVIVVVQHFNLSKHSLELI